MTQKFRVGDKVRVEAGNSLMAAEGEYDVLVVREDGTLEARHSTREVLQIIRPGDAKPVFKTGDRVRFKSFIIGTNEILGEGYGVVDKVVDFAHFIDGDNGARHLVYVGEEYKDELELAPAVEYDSSLYYCVEDAEMDMDHVVPCEIKARGFTKAELAGKKIEILIDQHNGEVRFNDAAHELLGLPDAEEGECEPDPAPVDNYHAAKFDKGKRDWSLLPMDAVAEMLRFEVDAQDGETEDPETNAEGVLLAGACFAKFEATGCRDELLLAFLAFSGSAHPVALLDEVVEVLEFGAKKYARDSWRSVPDAQLRYTSAAWRHLAALARGEERDADSGLGHRGHFLTNLLFVMELSR